MGFDRCGEGEPVRRRAAAEPLCQHAQVQALPRQHQDYRGAQGGLAGAREICTHRYMHASRQLASSHRSNLDGGHKGRADLRPEGLRDSL